MKLKYDPFALVFARGDAVTRLACLEFLGLRDSLRAKENLLGLIKGQRSDGSFPSRLDPENWGMRETVRSALWLLKLGLPPAGVNVDSAVRFVVGRQNPDGGWCENPALEIPPEKTELSNERSVTWITADVVELLRGVGMADSTVCEAAVAWLRSMQNQRGGWPCYAVDGADQRGDTGDPDSTVQITFLMGEIYGEDDPVYKKGRELFERNLDACSQDAERGYRIRARDGERVELDAYGLTFLLLSSLVDPPRRLQHGYDVSDPRVQRMMQALIDVQRADGGWRPFWSDESSPVYTVLAVKTLVLSGMVARADLERYVRAHVA